nr:MFS transporter [Candidatus Pantoea persica]
MLLAFGVANFFGTSLAGGYLVTRSVSLTLSGVALLLVNFGDLSLAGRRGRGAIGTGVWLDVDRLVHLDFARGAGRR